MKCFFLALWHDLTPDSGKFCLVCCVSFAACNIFLSSWAFEVVLLPTKRPEVYEFTDLQVETFDQHIVQTGFSLDTRLIITVCYSGSNPASEQRARVRVADS